MGGLKIVISFVLGGAIGAGGMFLGLKKYYEQKAEEEIKEARESFHRLAKSCRGEKDSTEKKESESEEPVEEESPNQNGVVDVFAKKSYYELLKRVGYSVNLEKDQNVDDPYVINEDDFNEFTNSKAYLTWVSRSDILCDTNTGVIYDEIEELIGEEGTEILCEEALPKFYMRNPKFGIDFVIRIELDKTYHEIFAEPD